MHRNVNVKLSGLGNFRSRLPRGGDGRSSGETVEIVGAKRGLFGSNFE